MITACTRCHRGDRSPAATTRRVARALVRALPRRPGDQHQPPQQRELVREHRAAAGREHHDFGAVADFDLDRSVANTLNEVTEIARNLAVGAEESAADVVMRHGETGTTVIRQARVASHADIVQLWQGGTDDHDGSRCGAEGRQPG